MDKKSWKERLLELFAYPLLGALSLPNMISLAIAIAAVHLPFVVDMVLIALVLFTPFGPLVRIALWIAGLVVMILGKQDVFAIIYYILFALGFFNYARAVYLSWANNPRRAQRSPAAESFRANLRKINTLYRCRFSFKRNKEAGKPISDASYIARGCFVYFTVAFSGIDSFIALIRVLGCIALFVPYVGTLAILAVWVLGFLNILFMVETPLIPAMVYCAALAARLIAMTVRTVKFLRR